MKTNIIKIDKGIPVPELRWGGKLSRLAFIKDIEIGDSFVINGNTPDLTPKSAISSAYSLASKLRKKGGNTSDFRVAYRTLEGSPKNLKAIRIWRVQ